jgi:hypothetical protein
MAVQQGMLFRIFDIFAVIVEIIDGILTDDRMRVLAFLDKRYRVIHGHFQKGVFPGNID